MTVGKVNPAGAGSSVPISTVIVLLNRRGPPPLIPRQLDPFHLLDDLQEGWRTGPMVRAIVATLVAMTPDGQMALRDVKNRLSEVVDQVEREHGRVVITKHGRPAAVVMSVEDLESLEETLDVMGKPRLLKQIRDSLAEAGTGETETLSKDEALALLRG